jgi:hypothetical protein
MGLKCHKLRMLLHSRFHRTTSFNFLVVKFVHFMAKLFSFRHKGTKTLRTNNKIKSFVS